MYPDVVRWLKKFLDGRKGISDVEVFDTHDVYLSALLPSKGYTSMDYPTYEIKVDIAGVFRFKEKEQLALVECKLNHLRLMDVAQTIGYSKVAVPEYSFLVSPAGLNGSLTRLFSNYNRTDVLEYSTNKYVTVARWEPDRTDISFNEYYPRGNL